VIASRRSTERLSPLRKQQDVADLQQPEARYRGTVADDIAEDAALFIRPILFDQSGNRHGCVQYTDGHEWPVPATGDLPLAMSAFRPP
jgi:hypothetical protein